MSSNSNQLPFLPGYKVETEKVSTADGFSLLHTRIVPALTDGCVSVCCVLQRDRFHKPHYFEVSNGTRIDNSQQLSINAIAASQYRNNNPADPLLITPSPASSLNTTYTASNPPHSLHTALPAALSASMSVLPAWLAYDRKVLRFYGFFKEAVHSSPVETWRVRRCVLYFYLEDESMHIAEPKIENSGIPQGVFVKRHRIPRPDASNSLYSFTDLAVGRDVLIYGRVIRLVDADAFTRDFYGKQGVRLQEAEEYPLDAFTAASQPSTASTHKQMHPHKLYMEAALGKPMLPSAAATQQFLTLDGHVLRFYAQWDDDKMYGEKKPYIIHYYLADDTVEVNEVQTANNGRDPFPTLLKRGRLPKDWQSGIPNVAKLGAVHSELTSSYYSLLDFRIGNTINVYGRLLLICSLDRYTQQYYVLNFGMEESDFAPINMSDPETELAALTPPPYNGFGTEEDSLGSFLFLVPRVPKTDFKRLQDYDGVHLRFLARLSNASKVDRDRRFIINLHAGTEQISVFERVERNSGFLGGKFLEKSRLKNPRTGSRYEFTDFPIGGTVRINEYEFELLEADEYTRKWTDKQQQQQQAHPTGKREEEKTQL